ncbi:MAG TPA: TIGR02281 family clan AA aspartic protease [Hyphomicrobiaceae bacterium]|jgi:aspartyl protease family protein|nr:TIGR02281 family clan AA aspartic protease [Hyphomicrobiaceae bacterium]
MAAWVALLLLVIAGVALLMRADVGSIAGYDPSDFALVVSGFALLIFIAASVAGSYRGRAGQAMRDMLAWSLLGAALFAGYSYRERIVSFGHQVLGDLLPADSLLRSDNQVDQERSVRIRKRPDGHFMVHTEANGVLMQMLVDTGASTVVLRPEDGRLLGFEVDQLRYVVPVQTANGTTYAASIHLKTLSVGKIRMNNVEALVAKRGALRENLLGMSFLNRLNSYEFSGEYLTLRKL